MPGFTFALQSQSLHWSLILTLQPKVGTYPDLKIRNSYTILLVIFPKFSIPFLFPLSFHCLKGIWMDIQSFWLKLVFPAKVQSFLEYPLPTLPHIFKKLERPTVIHQPLKGKVFHIFTHALILFKRNCWCPASLSSRTIIRQVLRVEASFFAFRGNMLMSTWSFSCLIHFCSFQLSKSKLVPERSDESGRAPITAIIIIVIELVMYPGPLINTLPRKKLCSYSNKI